MNYTTKFMITVATNTQRQMIEKIRMGLNASAERISDGIRFSSDRRASLEASRLAIACALLRKILALSEKNRSADSDRASNTVTNKSGVFIEDRK